jgi:hypothetical protein
MLLYAWFSDLIVLLDLLFRFVLLFVSDLPCLMILMMFLQLITQWVEIRLRW